MIVETGLRNIPGNRTLISAGNWTDEAQNFDKWTPYVQGGTHQKGVSLLYEPLYYYNGLGDRTYAWLATGFEYNADSTELTYTLRSEVNWSDGEPFNADDVVYTLNSLRDMGAEVRNGQQVQEFVDRAEAVNDLTVKIYFKKSAPKFHDFMTHNGDNGIWIVPEHEWQGKDWTVYSAWRDGKGPITTSPWRVAHADIQQRIVDRVRSCDEWWACRTGFSNLPEVERYVLLSTLEETQYVNAVIQDRVDTTHDTQPANAQRALSQNSDVTTWSGKEGPYGLVSWWPSNIYMNHDDPHLGKKEVRKAISYYINRDQVIQFGLSGNGFKANYPWPAFESLNKYEEILAPIAAEKDLGVFDVAKGDALLTGEGYTKDGAGFWADSSGDRIACELLGTSPHFTNSGPVIAQQLRQNGIEAEYNSPTDKWTRAAEGDYTCDLRGNNGGHKDPYLTMLLYRSDQGPADVLNWSNSEYDRVVTELGVVNPVTQEAEFTQKVSEGMEIWIEDLPSIPVLQFLNSPIRTTKYWTNWPSSENPYMNGLFLHTGFPYTLLQLKATNAQ